MNTYIKKEVKEKRLTCNYNYIELVINKTMILFFSNKFSIVFVVDVIGFPTATAVVFFFGVVFVFVFLFVVVVVTQLWNLGMDFMISLAV